MQRENSKWWLYLFCTEKGLASFAPPGGEVVPGDILDPGMLLLCFQVPASKKQLFFMLILTRWLRCWQSWQSRDRWSCCTRWVCNRAGCACWPRAPGAFVELPASAGNACAAAALLLGFSLPGNPRHVVSTAEGWGASGRREMYPSQPQNLVSLFIWHIFWKSLGKGIGNMGGDEKLLRYWKV